MKFESEAALCALFRDWCAGRYDVHAECHGWDLILVDNDNRRLGVQAKLKDGLVAISQCLEKMREQNVEASAILMPEASDSLRRLCRVNTIGVIVPAGLKGDWQINGRQEFDFNVPIQPLLTRIGGMKPLPATPSNLPAGVPSPRSIKDYEFMLEVVLNRRGGYLTSKDFERIGAPLRFPPTWLYKFKGRPRWEPTEIAKLHKQLPSQLDPKAYAAMEKRMESVRV